MAKKGNGARAPRSAGSVQTGSPKTEMENILAELEALREELVEEVARQSARLALVHPVYQESARNLLHYLALRRRDLRPLQRRLASLGLSSLGRAEAHVLATIDAVLCLLRRAVGQDPEDLQEPGGIAIDKGDRVLAENTKTLLGPATPGRRVRIMVTMPGEAAENYGLVHDLLQQGMDCMRINCAHDEPAAWQRMIEHLRRAEKVLGRSCRVVMDLGGPKLRTGPIESGPAVFRVRPRRDAFGRVNTPARIWLTCLENPFPSPSPADLTLALPAAFLQPLHVGEKIRLTDCRGARRSWRVVDSTDQGCWVEVRETTYLIPGSELRAEGRNSRNGTQKVKVGELPPLENTLLLRSGDTLILTRDLVPGRAATHDSAGAVLTPAKIGCSLPEVFEDVRAGDSIFFDDGKMGGVVQKVDPDRVVVQIRQTRLGGDKLRADKGINLPESTLQLAALTAKDLQDLPFVAAHADVVELSFANRATDVEELQQELARLSENPPAIVLKVETRRGFENLPEMLLTAMRSPGCGVMIARGDLAVECGFERMAEVQEEILWICEAAHVPVIWATQVLETLAKEGIPSRAEITDAAMGDRAECVMLNKGPHVGLAVRALDDILRRMQTHLSKKRAMLRELRLAHTLPDLSGVAEP